MPAARPQVWRERFPEACRWDEPLEITTVPELLRRGAARDPDAPAIEFRGRRLTYRALSDAVERLAAGLLASGLGPGSTVALYLPNTPDHPIAFLAALRAGARVVHVGALDAPREVAHKLRDSGARVLVTTDLAPLLPTALGLIEGGHVDRVLVGGDRRWGGDAPAPAIPWGEQVLPLHDLAAAPPPAWPEIDPDDVALLQYTGGTTGTPKAALLTHANLSAAVSMYRAWADGAVTPPGSGRVIAVLPLFHIFALTAILLRNLRDGNELLLRARFDPGAVLDDIEAGRATAFSGVPTMWFALLNHPGFAERDLSSLTSCVSGGAPMPFEVEQRLERILSLRLTSGWGMTETAPAGSRVPRRATPRPGLIGVPLPGIDMRVVSLDDPTRGLAPGEVGEIAIRGPNVFKGYWNRPEETERAFADGYFLTGDVGRMDRDGLFDLVDRRKNMIISSGFNVYPVTVEGAIYEHPDVEEAAVIGVPDPYRGQAAKAFVKLREGAPPLTLDALRAFLADRLGRHEMPAALEIRPALPRSAAGKLLTRVLVDEERARAAAASHPERPL